MYNGKSAEDAQTNVNYVGKEMKETKKKETNTQSQSQINYVELKFKLKLNKEHSS